MKNSEYIDLFLQEAKKNIDKLISEIENNDPSEKINLEISRRAAHSLKSEAAMMKYSSMSECAKRIEQIFSAQIDGANVVNSDTIPKLEETYQMLKKSLASIQQESQELDLSNFPNIIY